MELDRWNYVNQFDVLLGERHDGVSLPIARFVGSAQHDEGQRILRR